MKCLGIYKVTIDSNEDNADDEVTCAKESYLKYRIAVLKEGWKGIYVILTA